MIWRIRISIFIAASAVISALVWCDLSSWWTTLLVGLACAWVDRALVERLVRGPKVREAVLYVLSDFGELPGNMISSAVIQVLGSGPVRRYLAELHRAGLVSSRGGGPEYEDHRLFYSITAAGRAALWSRAQNGER